MYAAFFAGSPFKIARTSGPGKTVSDHRSELAGSVEVPGLLPELQRIRRTGTGVEMSPYCCSTLESDAKQTLPFLVARAEDGNAIVGCVVCEDNEIAASAVAPRPSWIGNCVV